MKKVLTYSIGYDIIITTARDETQKALEKILKKVLTNKTRYDMISISKEREANDMKICKEVDFYELKENSWSGAIETLNTVEEWGMEDDLMYFLEEVFNGETPTETEVNDFLRFEDEYIFETLGINAEEDEESEE